MTRVNPKAGEQTIIATGPLLSGLYGIALGLHGKILLPDADAFALLGGSFELDPTTGPPTKIASLGLLSEPGVRQPAIAVRPALSGATQC